ncbi:MAG: DNA polymerase IV [Thermoguttaceae bacterium]|nr:DNA polymerase IV [Thermoguttaceae bacterium]
MKRLIFHIDVNSAFLSWEAARRVAAGERDIRLIPSAIGGDREKRTGIILAKSIPAKKYNVTTGEPVGMALRKCPGLFLAKPDFALYDKCSQAFMGICRNYAPVVEQFSIDECFLDMTGTERLYSHPIDTATRIKNEIRDSLGFTVNVGIGPNKLLAKMASDFEKPDKVHTLFESEIPVKMWPLPIRDLYMAGRATAERLQHVGITTIGRLAATDVKTLQSLVGIAAGERLHDSANGMDDSPVLAEEQDAKGYSNSTTLAKDVTTTEEAYPILFALVDSTASRMRAGNAKASVVAVSIRSKDFKDRSHQKKLSIPTDVTSCIYEAVKQLFSELWDRRTPLRQLGVCLSGLDRSGVEQQVLFPDEDKERGRKADQIMDMMRDKFGQSTISWGTSLNSDREVGVKDKARRDNRR